MSRHDWPIDVDPVYGCWIYRGKRDREGYAFARNGKRAHIAVYESERGPVPRGNELDHECRRRACCNPEHLAIVTRSENELRKMYRYRIRVKSCSKGHAYPLHRMMTPEGGYVCRACLRLTNTLGMPEQGKREEPKP